MDKLILWGEVLIGGVAYTSSGIIYEELAPKIQEQKQKNEKTAEKESDLQQNQNNDETIRFPEKPNKYRRKLIF